MTIKTSMLASVLMLFAVSCNPPPVERPVIGKNQPLPGTDDSEAKGVPNPEPTATRPVSKNEPEGAAAPDSASPPPAGHPNPGPAPGQAPGPASLPTPMPLPAPVPTPKPDEAVKDPGTSGDGRFDLTPAHDKSPRFDSNPNITDNDVEKGTVKPFTMLSKDSKIFMGKDDYLKEKGDFQRKGELYIPFGYKGEELPVIFVGDGGWGQHKLLVPVLNNLIAKKMIPKMAAVFLEPGPLGGGDGPGSQRSLEYDSVDDRFARFVEEEVFVKVQKDFNIKFTKNPEGRATMGGSSSGSMAFTMAWFRPDLFRRVITYSGTFVNRKPTGDIMKGAWDYHSNKNLIGNSAKKPLRVTLEVGQNDNKFNDPENDWIVANNQMFNVLTEKGYHVRFHYVEKVGHIDMDVYKHTLSDNLVWLWAGYPIK